MLQGAKPVEDAPFTNTPLSYAMEAFVANTDTVHSAVEDFSSSFDASDRKALQDYLANITKNNAPASNYEEGFEATVVAIKSNEAVVSRQKIIFQKEWFQI